MSALIVELCNISKSYPAAGRKRQSAIRGIFLHVDHGEAVGLTGPSGSGKSTLARIILGLERPDSGEVFFLGNPISSLSAKGKWLHFRQVQMVWQDPTAYLNPYQPVWKSIIEPMMAFKNHPAGQIRARGLALMEMLGLPEALGSRRPAQLSAGQCQRVTIARALSTDPALLICDEALVNLDLPQQVSLLKLLKRLQAAIGLSILFISHDRDTVKALCSRTLTMTADGRCC